MELENIMREKIKTKSLGQKKNHMRGLPIMSERDEEPAASMSYNFRVFNGWGKSTKYNRVKRPVNEW